MQTDFIEPKVLIGVGGKQKDLNYDYGNVDVLFSDNLRMSPSEMFNTFGKKRNYDIFLFMNDSFGFADEYSLLTLVKRLWSNDLINVGGLYSDINLVMDNEIIPIKYHYAYDSRIMYSKILMNIPFIIKSSICPIFNEDLEELYLYDAFLKTVQSSFIFNVPKCLFNLEKFDEINPKIAKEIQLINNGK